MEGAITADTRFWFSNISGNVRQPYQNHAYWKMVNPHDSRNRIYFNRTDAFGANSWEHSPVIPILAVAMLAITVFLLILFRHNPGLVAGTVAGSLIILGIYLTLNHIQENKPTLE